MTDYTEILARVTPSTEDLLETTRFMHAQEDAQRAHELEREQKLYARVDQLEKQVSALERRLRELE